MSIVTFTFYAKGIIFSSRAIMCHKFGQDILVWSLWCPQSYCPPLSRERGDIKSHSSVCPSLCPSVRPSVRLSVCHKNFNLAHIFWSIKDRALIFGMHDPCDKPFQVMPCHDLWPSSRSKLLPSGGPQFSKFACFYICRLWAWLLTSDLGHAWPCQWSRSQSTNIKSIGNILSWTICEPIWSVLFLLCSHAYFHIYSLWSVNRQTHSWNQYYISALQPVAWE